MKKQHRFLRQLRHARQLRQHHTGDMSLAGIPTRYKISFCIICMNRLYHLRKTLLRSIRDNAHYSSLEIILLDYNSKDNMEKWVRKYLRNYIKQNRVIYYKTFQPAVFNHSHSKNLAFKLATGDIVCNINADNFVGRGFAEHINDAFQHNPTAFLCPDPTSGFGKGSAGIICVYKPAFLQIGGFDEKMMVYGWEDVDLINRLELSGVEKKYVSNTAFLKAIDHVRKYDEKKLLSRIHAVYVDTTEPFSVAHVKVLVLFRDHTFRLGTIINNKIKVGEDPAYAQLFASKKRRFQFELEEVAWSEGSWREDAPDMMSLHKGQHTLHELAIGRAGDKRSLHSAGSSLMFYEVTDKSLLDVIAYFEMDYNNRMVMINNEAAKKTVCNEGRFGQAVVYRNFNYRTSIQVS